MHGFLSRKWMLIGQMCGVCRGEHLVGGLDRMPHIVDVVIRTISVFISADNDYLYPWVIGISKLHQSYDLINPTAIDIEFSSRFNALRTAQVAVVDVYSAQCPSGRAKAGPTEPRMVQIDPKRVEQMVPRPPSRWLQNSCISPRS
jgi:hypothetical protein